MLFGGFDKHKSLNFETNEGEGKRFSSYKRWSLTFYPVLRGDAKSFGPTIFPFCKSARPPCN